MTLGNKATQSNQIAFGHQFALRQEILTNSEQSVEQPCGVKALPEGAKTAAITCNQTHNL